MGVGYIVDSEPIFLTSKNYNLILKEMINSGVISEKELNAIGIFDEKAKDDLDEKIISFIKENEKMNNYCEFDLTGLEAQKEVSTLLDAYHWWYGGFEFERFSMINNSFMSFSPFEYLDGDLNYPFGKTFAITKGNKKGFLKKKNESLLHIIIETKKAIHIKGKLSSFEIEFSNGRYMAFHKEEIIIL